MIEHRRPLLAARYLLLGLAGVVMLMPFVWMVSASLMTPLEIAARPPVWLPREPQWHNYGRVLEVIPFLRAYLNSLIVTVSTVLLILLTSSLAGFAFAKYQFRGRSLLFLLTLSTLMVPPFMTIIPLFWLVKQLGWLNSYLGLIVPGAVSAYGVFLMRQFMLDLPDELLDAARIDGASELGIWWRIVLPLSGPAMATLGALSFIATWNAFLWPLLVVQDPRLFTIPLALNSLRLYAVEARNINLLMAGTTLAVIPVLAVFVFAQRYFVRGIVLTGLKG